MYSLISRSAIYGIRYYDPRAFFKMTFLEFLSDTTQTHLEHSGNVMLRQSVQDLKVQILLFRNTTIRFVTWPTTTTLVLVNVAGFLYTFLLKSHYKVILNLFLNLGALQLVTCSLQ
jgi:hypothetical protein